VTVEGAHRLDPAVVEGLQIGERLMRLEILRLRASGNAAGDDEYRGLYISDEEIDQLLARDEPQQAELAAGFARERAALGALAQGATGPLGRLVRLAGLNAFEVGCLLLGLALEADARFERLVAYVQDDVTKRRPRVALAFRLLGGDPNGLAERRCFSAAGPLRRLHLLGLHSDPGQPFTPLPSQSLALNPRVAGFLLGQDEIDEALRPHARLSQPQEAGASMLPPPLAGRLDELGALAPTALAPPVLHLTGRDGHALEQAAARLARPSAWPLLVVNLPALATVHGVDHALDLAEREGALQPAALVIADAHTLKPEEAERLRSRLASRPAFTAPLVILLSDGRFHWPGLTIPLPDPDYGARLELWRRGLERLDLPEGAGPGASELAGLADRFRLTGQQIADAIVTAKAAALWRNPTAPQVEVTDLYAAARTQSTPILSNLASKLTPHYRWEDIVLPPDALAQMREICAYVEHRHTVYEQWGFGRKVSLGLGLRALFAGESGTGKTMASDIIAGALGLDLYKIDLSNVISKYIGETEKNLNRIFAEAETSNAILFFDEADALFGKRSEVKDAHDRYANIETAYLLQKTEEYDGVVILATNLKMNIDDAFMRRMHFVVDFPVPDEDDRRRIWQGSLPAELPLGADVDMEFLARKFRITGGNIRNITLLAAFLAAADGRVVGMQHLIQATRREFQKIGRMVTPSDFERYYALFDS
jgi:AAA+ superfamily predicted ATPase